MADKQEPLPRQETAKPERKVEGRPPPDRDWVTTELLHANRDEGGNITFTQQQ